MVGITALPLKESGRLRRAMGRALSLLLAPGHWDSDIGEVGLRFISILQCFGKLYRAGLCCWNAGLLLFLRWMQRQEGVKIETKSQNKQPYCFAFASFKTWPEPVSQFLYLAVLRFIFILNFVYLYVSVDRCVCMHAGGLRIQKRPSHPPELELQAVVSCPMGAGNQTQASAGVVCILNCWAVSQVLHVGLWSGHFPID